MLLRVRPVAGQGRRPRLHQRVHALRPDHPRATSPSPRARACGARSSPWGRRSSGFRSSPPAKRIARTSAVIGTCRRPLRLRAVHVNAVALGSLLLGFAAVLLMHAVLATALRRRRGAACRAPRRGWPRSCTGTWSSSPRCPTRRPLRGRARGLALGSAPRRAHRRRIPGPRPRGRRRHVPALAERGAPGAARLSISSRPAAARRGWPRSWPAAAALAAGACSGAFPQMAAWNVLYGEWVLLPYPPHGARLPAARPSVRAGDAVLVAPRAALLDARALARIPGLRAALARRRRGSPLPLLLPLVLMTYVNMCSRRLVGGRLVLEPPLRQPAARARLRLGRRPSSGWRRLAARPAPSVALALVAAPVVPGTAPCWRSPPRACATGRAGRRSRTRVGSGAQLLADAVGQPAAPGPRAGSSPRGERLPPGQYDRLVGRYLFYRQNNLDGHVDARHSRTTT